MPRKIEKMFPLSKKIASENLAINCIDSEENTWYWQVMG